MKCHLILLLLILPVAMLSSLFIAALFIGVNKKDQCPSKTELPLWLIVFGAAGLGPCAIGICIILASVCVDDTEDNRGARVINKCLTAVSVLVVGVSIFFIAWAITGLVWISSISRGVFNIGSLAEGRVCDGLVYRFVLGMSITWILLFVLPIVLACCALKDSNNHSAPRPRLVHTGPVALIVVLPEQNRNVRPIQQA